MQRRAGNYVPGAISKETTLSEGSFTKVQPHTWPVYKMCPASLDIQQEDLQDMSQAHIKKTARCAAEDFLVASLHCTRCQQVI